MRHLRGELESRLGSLAGNTIGSKDESVSARKLFVVWGVLPLLRLCVCSVFSSDFVLRAILAGCQVFYCLLTIQDR